MKTETRGALTPQQLRFFKTFGFLHIPGFLGQDVEKITDAFEDVFASTPSVETRTDTHFGQRRLAIGNFLENDPRLHALETDPRIRGVVDSILGPESEYCQTDGNILYCDSAWHCDIYGSPLDRFHIKLFFYLDVLDGESGALRMIPGTNHYNSKFAVRLRRELVYEDVAKVFGVSVDQIPAWTIPNQPGDLVVGNYRTIHATFNGIPRRRLFTMNYREAEG